MQQLFTEQFREQGSAGAALPFPCVYKMLAPGEGSSLWPLQ